MGGQSTDDYYPASDKTYDGPGEAVPRSWRRAITVLTLGAEDRDSLRSGGQVVVTQNQTSKPSPDALGALREPAVALVVCAKEGGSPAGGASGVGDTSTIL